MIFNINLWGDVMDLDFVTAKEKAQEWGISLRRVQLFCEQGRIDGMRRLGKVYIIPKDAPRPKDGRYKANKFVDQTEEYA